MTRDDIAHAVKLQIDRAAGVSGDLLDDNRAAALDYYFMRPGSAPAMAGRSAVISGDVSAMTDAVLSQMLNAFTTDNVVEFEPNGPDDEEQVHLESAVVSNQVMEQNNGYTEFQQSIKDALLQRNGIIKVYVDEKITTARKTFNNVEPEAVESIIKGSTTVKVEVLNYDPEAKTLKIKATETVRKLCVQSVAPEDFLYTSDWWSLDLTEIPLVAEHKYWTRSQLREMGYSRKVVDELVPYNNIATTAQASRNPQVGANTPHPVPSDPAQDIIEGYEAYCLIDADDDGISERHRVLMSVDGVLIDDEEVPMVPYAVGAVFLASHRLLGISLFDKIKHIQDINTQLNRALLDNSNACNKSRIAYLDGAVEVDDLSDPRVNGNIRVKSGQVQDVRLAITPFVVPDISAGILAAIEHQKRNRAELGGASLELASGQAQLASAQVGSQGLDRAYSVMEQLASMMTKNIAETLVKHTFQLAHATLRYYFDQPVSFRVAGKWQTAIPNQWPERKRLNVKVGMSAGERNRKVQAISYILDKQAQVMQANGVGVLVNLNGFHNALIDWGRSAEIDNPEKYWMDPESPASKAGAANIQKQAAASQEAQKKLLDQAIAIEGLKIAIDKYKSDADRQFKYYDAVLSAEIEEAKIVGSATTELAKAELGQGTPQDPAPKKGKPELVRVTKTTQADGSKVYVAQDADGDVSKVMDIAPDADAQAKATVDRLLKNGT